MNLQLACNKRTGTADGDRFPSHKRRLRHGKSVFLLLEITSSLLGQTNARASLQGKPDFTTVKEYIRAQMASQFIPSIAVAVAHDGDIIWEQAFGLADRENRRAATPHTPYYTASVTKSITGTAIMLLRQRRELDLDHPVNEYLGPSKVRSPMWDPSKATVRRVATHTRVLQPTPESVG